jgi:NADPH:quinone reductase-like Zn-dependent oxidoreductase
VKYRCVLATKRGGPDSLQVVEKELRDPTEQEARVRTLAVPVCLPDVEARYGRTPFPIRFPFVPGYAIVGDVDAIGDRVANAVVGDRVAALIVHGGYAEYVFLHEKELIPVPSTVDPVEAAPLILNYMVAYQTLHRTVKVKSGDKVVIIGAGGGIGTALLDLGRQANLTMYGVASKSKRDIISEFGATPIDYETEDFVQVVRNAEPNGVRAVFDGVGGDYLKRGFSLLQRGGAYVGYANPHSRAGTVRFLTQLIRINLLPNGRSAKSYGTGASRFIRRRFMEDWATLFRMLESGAIKPVIMKRLPILHAAQANALLENGQVIGNIVLSATEPIQPDSPQSRSAA